MRFDTPLIEGVLLRRFKRFMVDVELADGSVVTAHTSNTGSMQGCSAPGSRVWLSDSKNLKRKYPLSWELVEVEEDVLIGIRPALANDLVSAAIQSGELPGLIGYETLKREVKWGDSRLDIKLSDSQRGECWVEVKSATMKVGDVVLFPDSVTARGRKHLYELADVVKQGHRAVIFFCAQRDDGLAFSPADEIDPAYGKALREVMQQGVEAMAWCWKASPEGIEIQKMLPVVC